MTALSSVIQRNFFPVAFPRPVGELAAKVLKLDEADTFYATLQGAADPSQLPAKLLQYIRVSVQIADTDRTRIPKHGPTMIVANHPFGLLESAALLTAVREVRSDVRIIANEILAGIPEIRELIIPVDVLRRDRNANVSGVRQALRFLRAGGAIIAFPAGMVSHFHWQQWGAIDPPWQPSLGRLMEMAAQRGAGPSVLPAFVPGSNSVSFQAAGILHAGLRTALLGRELFNKKGMTVELRFGSVVSYERLASMASFEERIEYLRSRTYLLANRQAYKPETREVRRRTAAVAPIAAAGSSPALAQEISCLPPSTLLEQSGALAVYIAESSQIPSILEEIGRLREISFRSAGEGTGKSRDLDQFDEQYLHLFVWDSSSEKVVAGYRLQVTDAGKALYTNTLFAFDEHFLPAITPALELGRSFVRSEYQRSFAPLVLLWKGIGKIVASKPQYKILFGPVTISNRYSAVSRELILGFLEKRAGHRNWIGMVKARSAPARIQARFDCSDIEELSDVVRDIDPESRGIPILLRHYLRLGGKLVGFNIDPAFSNALDGLILVDLTQTEPKLVQRYLGKREADQFFQYHKEHPHGT